MLKKNREEEETVPKVSPTQQTSQFSAMGLRRQMSDSEQETDVSQLIDDEVRGIVSVHKLFSDLFIYCHQCYVFGM